MFASKVIRDSKMSSQANIDIKFSSDYEPKKLVKLLLTFGWEFNIDGYVEFLCHDDVDSYDWQSLDYVSFNLEEFLESHNAQEKIGLSMLLEKDIGGNLLIYPDWMTISLSINRLYLSNSRIPNFNWYLNKLELFLKEIDFLSINCELIQ